MIIAVTGLKGGSGKTTIAINLAVCFAQFKQDRCCIVDADQNMSAYHWRRTRDKNSDLTRIEVITPPPILVMGNTVEQGLIRLVAQLHKQYPVVIVDGTPSLSSTNTEIMAVADMIIIPVRPGATDYSALEGIYNRLQEVQEARRKIGRREAVVRFLLNQYDERLTNDRYIVDAIKRDYPDIQMFETTVKTRTIYNFAGQAGAGVWESEDDKGKGKNEIMNLFNEITKLAKEEDLKILELIKENHATQPHPQSHTEYRSAERP